MSSDIDIEELERVGRLLMPSFVAEVRKIVEPFNERLDKVESHVGKVAVVFGLVGVVAGWLTSLATGVALKLIGI